jgi:serine/threonine protein kinase
MQSFPKPVINSVRNRFLPLPEAVVKGLEPEPKLSDFQTLQDLGVGSFGKVFLVMHKVTKVKYAIKAIDKRNKNNIESKPYFRREIEIMYKIHHPNVVRLFSHFEDNQNCYFIMEFISQGNFYNLLLKQKNKCLEPQMVAKLMKDIINAVYFLHQMNPPIIHRDIKPENALLSENSVSKLTDFGWSNYINDENEQRNTFCGTPIYLAPEMIQGTGHDERVDIWCIGCLMFELLVGRPPFSGPNKEGLMYNILKNKITYPNTLDEDAKDLIQQILKTDPKQRISLQDIIKHSFFTKFYPNVSDELIKPNQISDIPPYVISKDTPQSVVTKKEKASVKKKRDVSPVPETKLHLEQLKDSKGCDVNTNCVNDNKLKIENEKLIEEKEQLLKKYNELIVSYTNLEKEHNKYSELINNANGTIQKLQKEKEDLMNDVNTKELEIQELKQSKENERKSLISSFHSNEQQSQQMIEELEKKLRSEEEENETLKNRIKELEEKENVFEETNNQEKVSQISGNVNNNMNIKGTFNDNKDSNDIEEKYEVIIKELKQKHLQSENERIKEKERLVNMIKKYEEVLDKQSVEIKKQKAKIKKLQAISPKTQFNKTNNW